MDGLGLREAGSRRFRPGSLCRRQGAELHSLDPVGLEPLRSEQLDRVDR